VKRLVQLAGFLFVGYVAGVFAIRIVAAIAKVDASGPFLPIAGGVGAAAISLLLWRGGGRRVASSDAQGSARFATAKDAERTLGGQDGLIVGRAMTGALLRYDGRRTS
jgi:type IV secretory pathway TraG/TraD family ATPase VirD4